MSNEIFQASFRNNFRGDLQNFSRYLWLNYIAIALVRSQLCGDHTWWKTSSRLNGLNVEQPTWLYFRLQNMVNKTLSISFNVHPWKSDILFFVSSLKNPTTSYNITSYVSFTQSVTRSNSVKLNHNISSTNKDLESCHFWICRPRCRLWNSLPIIDTSLPVETIKRQHQMLSLVILNFSSTDPHKLVPVVAASTFILPWTLTIWNCLSK